MLKKNFSLDEIDKRILELLQKDARMPLGHISTELGIPKSTVSYRIKNLEANKIIKGYYAEVEATNLGKDYSTIMFVRAKHGPNYPEKIGNLLAQIPGVCAVYFILGDNDFVVITLSNNREELMKKLEKMYSMPEIERISTVVVGKTIKEDPRIDFRILKNNNL